jgi:predicted DCC family thiol-disulfide oxidoreductase YuxK
VPDPGATVLYDRDCGFCRVTLARILALDRRRRLRPVAIQSELGQTLLRDLPAERRLDSWHLVTPDGRVHSAGAGFPPLLRLLPGGAPLAALLGRLPRLSEAGYRLVAGNRGLLGRRLPRRMIERASALIDERSGGADSVAGDGPPTRASA